MFQIHCVGNGVIALLQLHSFLSTLLLFSSGLWSMIFHFKILCQRWTCCSLNQLINCALSHQIYWCNISLLLLIWKLHDLLNYTLVIQSHHIRCSQRPDWMACFCSQFPVFVEVEHAELFSIFIMKAISRRPFSSPVWPEYTCCKKNSLPSSPFWLCRL